MQYIGVLRRLLGPQPRYKTRLSPLIWEGGGGMVLLPTLHFPRASHFRERGRELCGGKRMIILDPEPVSASTAEATQRSRGFFAKPLSVTATQLNELSIWTATPPKYIL